MNVWRHSHTFVIPTFGEPPWLERCLASLLDQTSRSTILVTTSTPNRYVRDIARRHGVPVIVNQVSEGIASDWNFAYLQAASDWVTLAHQDDTYARSSLGALPEGGTPRPQPGPRVHCCPRVARSRPSAGRERTFQASDRGGGILRPCSDRRAHQQAAVAVAGKSGAVSFGHAQQGAHARFQVSRRLEEQPGLAGVAGSRAAPGRVLCTFANRSSNESFTRRRPQPASSRRELRRTARCSWNSGRGRSRRR